MDVYEWTFDWTGSGSCNGDSYCDDALGCRRYCGCRACEEEDYCEVHVALCVGHPCILLVIVFHLGNMISMFIGVMGLKVSAYLQPYLMKWKEKKFSNET